MQNSKCKVQNLNSKSEIEGRLKKLKEDSESVASSKVEIETIKAEIKAQQGSISSDIAAVAELKAHVEGLKKESENKSKQLSVEHENVKKKIDALNGEQEKLQNILDKLKEMRSAAEADKASVQTDIQTIGQVKAQLEELKGQAQNANNELISQQNNLSGNISGITGIHEQAKQQYADLFEDQKDEAGSVIKKSTKTQIQEFFAEIKTRLDETNTDREDTKQQLDELRAKSKTDSDELKNKSQNDIQTLVTNTKNEFLHLKETLEADIRSLLPDAGAAGLASTYFEAKSKYAPTPFEGKLGSKSTWKDVAWHHAKSAAVGVIFYAMFIVPLAFIVYYFYDLMDYLKKNPQDPGKGFDHELWMFRALLTLPLATISYFGWSSIRLYRRLYEEYNHKQRVMQLYYSFKDEIKESGDDEQKKALLTIMLATVSNKPSLTMNRYDRSIEEMFPSLNIAAWLSGLIKGKKE